MRQLEEEKKYVDRNCSRRYFESRNHLELKRESSPSFNKDSMRRR